VLRAYIARYGFHPRRPMTPPTVQGGLVVSWCGMRGIVTLAAAFALPDGFPYRDLILLTAFVVVLGSLLIQGLTLGPLVKWLKLDTADPVAREVGVARAAAYRAALVAIDGDDTEAARLLRKEYQAVLSRADGDGGLADGDLPADPLRLRALAAARQAILSLREQDEIGDDAFHRLEEELDFAELNAGGRAG
jgi:CPA1 family monovalent cation:H+ antiporter